MKLTMQNAKQIQNESHVCVCDLYVQSHPCSFFFVYQLKLNMLSRTFSLLVWDKRLNSALVAIHSITDAKKL